MKPLTELDVYRIKTGRVFEHYGWFGDDTCGVFCVRSPTDQREMHIVASTGEGWEHVSVSRDNRCPNWPEMEFIKRKFFKDDEAVMQLHVPETDHINCHDYCLHLWRPLNAEIPRPPSYMVGPTGDQQ